MIGVIERIKNTVLLKCSNLNDEVITKKLKELIDLACYHFAEDVISLLGGIGLNISEDTIRENAKSAISIPITKKIKRKLFIDSLALQITNDSYIEEVINNKITLDDVKHNYLNELKKNKQSNQLNMTEDLKLDEIIKLLEDYVSQNIVPVIKENQFLVAQLNGLVIKMKDELEEDLEKMISDLDKEYLIILENELKNEIKEEEKIKGEDIMIQNTEVSDVIVESDVNKNKFDQYDDMTLFNKMLLGLNTREEKISRLEQIQKKKQEELEERLSVANKNIETNIERENQLSKRQLELNNKEVDLNAKLSEAEVIFLNMKPLIKGLNDIKSSDLKGGSSDE